MTRLLKSLLTLGAIAVVIVGAYMLMRDAAPTETACTDLVPRPQIIAFGDSLAAGFGATTPGGFVTLVAQTVGVPIENLGRNGDTTTTARERVAVLVRRNPDIVLISLGGNDGLRRTPVSDTEANLRWIIEEVTKSGAQVVLLGVPGGLPFSDPYPALFERLSALPNVHYVSNILGGLLGNQERMSDPIHPNEAGYAIIADRVIPAVRAACAQHSASRPVP